MWNVADVVVEPSRSQVLYFRYYECGQDSEGKEIRGPPDSRSMYFESSVDEFEGGSMHDGESFFWQSEVQGNGSRTRSRSSECQKRDSPSCILPPSNSSTLASKKRKCSVKSSRPEKRSSL